MLDNYPFITVIYEGKKYFRRILTYSFNEYMYQDSFNLVEQVFTLLEHSKEYIRNIIKRLDENLEIVGTIMPVYRARNKKEFNIFANSFNTTSYYAFVTTVLDYDQKMPMEPTVPLRWHLLLNDQVFN